MEDSAHPRPDAAVVAVFRSAVHAGEPWIVEQARFLREFHPILITLDPVGCPLEIDHVSLHDVSRVPRLEAATFRLAGRSWSLKRYLESLQPSLVHAHMGTDAIRLLDTCRSVGIPMVTTYHGFEIAREDAELSRGRWGDRLFVRRRSELIHHGALHIAVSNFIRDTMVAKGFPPARTQRHYIGVDTQFFSPGPRRSRDPWKLLFVGRLDHDKSPGDVLLIADQLRRSYPKVSVTMVGDGPLRKQLRRQAMKLGIDCQFTGILDRTSVRNLFRTASVLLGPSSPWRGAREVFGMVYLEAQACGLPVVAYRTGGVPEAVADGRSATLCDEGDVDQLAMAVRQLLIDPDRREHYGQAAVRFALTLDRRGQTKELENIYRRVLRTESSPSCRRPGADRDEEGR